MKNLFRQALLLSTLLVFLSSGINAKDFKGVVTYKVTIEGSQVNDQMRAMMPKTMTMMIKGNKAKVEMVTGMGKNVSITDGDTKTTIALLDMMGQKIAIKSTAEEIQKEIDKAGDAKVEITSETKEICGYTCKKAIIRIEKEEQEIIAYYTEELGNSAINFDNPQFKDINGVMLEFEMPNEQFTMHMTATSVEKKNIEDSEFQIPEGYQIKTKEEMQGMFGGE
jgi:GLPGLI family protein